MITKDGLYNLYKKLKDLLENPTKGRVKKFAENGFKYYTDFYYDRTSNWEKGAENFVKLANAINSGHISLDAFCVIFIGTYITKFKFITQKSIQNIDYIKELNKFYTVFETKRQQKEIIDKINEETMEYSFFEPKQDVYQVKTDQKNMLYELVKSGKVNLFHFIIAWHNHKFEIDENEITDEEYRKFIQYMKVIRDNMYKERKTTV